MSIPIKPLSMLLLASAFLALMASDALAQSDYTKSTLRNIQARTSASAYSINSYKQQSRNLARPRVSVPGLNYGFSQGSSAPRPISKPFSSVNRRSPVTPYLAYSGTLNTVSDYYNIIRPRQQQRQVNQQQQRQNFATQRRLSQLSAQAPYNPKGSDELAPTGHAAVFQNLGTYLNYGGYYPPASQGKR